MVYTIRSGGGILGAAMLLAACSPGAQSTHAGDGRTTGAVAEALPDSSLAEARLEIEPLFERMQTAANAHDVDGHLAAYVRDSTLIFVFNDRVIRGFAALREQQRQWWRGGNTDVAYRVDGAPDYRMPAPGVVVQTYLITSHRTLPDGTTRDGSVAITAVWQKRPEGWRIMHAHESTGPA